MTVLFVALGGGAGAVVRYLAGRYIRSYRSVPLATLAVNAERQGMDTFISSGDKDLCQIVDEHIRMVNPMDGTVLDPPGVMKKYGVRPDQMIDYLALVGDSVDNVPGIPGVGPKTAAKWLEQYGSLDEIVRHMLQHQATDQPPQTGFVVLVAVLCHRGHSECEQEQQRGFRPYFVCNQYQPQGAR